jgi:putative transposase
MVEGIIFRYRTGIARPDLPEVFAPWQTVWAWHRQLAGDSTSNGPLADVDPFRLFSCWVFA